MLSTTNLQALLDQMARHYSRGEAAAIAQMFSEDAQLHSPFAPPAIGRAEIQKLHVDWTAEPSDKKFTILDQGSTADMAWCLCHFAEGKQTGEGTSLIVLEQSNGGEWLIRSCCLFGDD